MTADVKTKGSTSFLAKCPSSDHLEKCPCLQSVCFIKFLVSVKSHVSKMSLSSVFTSRTGKSVHFCKLSISAKCQFNKGFL